MGERAQVQSQSKRKYDAAVHQVRHAHGLFGQIPGKSRLDLFAEKCEFDPATGCVMWIGGQSAGQGHSQPYGRFWDGHRMVYAHRWAAENIHGFDITGMQVDHWCPAGASTLCIEHVKPETAAVNRLLQTIRPGRCHQASSTKQYWLFVQRGIEPAPEPAVRDIDDLPFFEAPLWFRPYLIKPDYADACPF